MENYVGRVCPFCGREIVETDTVKVCPACGVAHHQQCWDQNHGCTTQGCPERPVEAQPEVPASTCPNCGAPIEPGKPFCGNCGFRMPVPQVNRCLRCYTELADNQSFCPNCGLRLGEAAIPTAPMEYPGNYGYSPYPQAAPKKKSKVPYIISGVIIAILGFIAVATLLSQCDSGSGSSGSISKKSDFNDMFSEYSSEYWCYIAADGSYMTVDTNPYNLDDKMELEAYYALEDINAELGFSAAVYSKMGETSALDGRQTETHGRYTVSWKYHPDTGMEVTYEIND